MPIQNNYRIFAGMTILLIAVGVTAVIALQLVNNPSSNIPTNPPPDDNDDEGTVIPTLNVTLLYNAGVMIETNETRIYIDPIQLNDTFVAYPADIVCVTHPHGDHYDPDSLDTIRSENTTFIFPANMSAEVALYDAIPVVPGDSVMVDNINITAYYMYTFPVDEYPASHPREANWTSYIIDIDGFVLFHAGDSKNLLEYYQLRGLIDLAFLPLGPGCQTMADYEVVSVITRINPTYFIPIHYTEGTQTSWIAAYGDDVESQSDCTPIVLDYWTMYSFELP